MLYYDSCQRIIEHEEGAPGHMLCAMAYMACHLKYGTCAMSHSDDVTWIEKWMNHFCIRFYLVSLILTTMFSFQADPVMTCYKLVTAEFKWFGFQNKVENIIHRSERRLFTNFHRWIFSYILFLINTFFVFFLWMSE